MKKVLSFVLILALVLGSFSFAFGLTDVVQGDANSDAINVSNDLGIIDGYPDGTFLPEKAVNRAEFAKMVTKALGVPDSALAGFTATKFKDTSGYGWAVPYLAFCDSKGIMLGDGMGNAMPGRTISVNEAVTMVLRAVGYVSNSSELIGVWPANYVTLAKDKGLYDDVATMVTVDRGNAAQILYNALTLAKVQVDVDGTTNYVTGTPTPTMLTAGLNCTEFNRGNAHVLTTLQADTAVINAQKYVGAFVKTFLNSDKEIVAIKPVSTFLTGKFNETDGVFKADGVNYDLVSTSAFKYAWYNDSATITSNVSPVAIANGQSSGGADLASKTAVTLAVDLSGKTIRAVYSYAIWTQENSFKFEEGDLMKDKIGIYKFKLDDNKAIDNSRFTLIGVNSLEDIAVDDVVTVYKKGSADTVIKLGVSSEKVTGTITNISADGEYTIDGKVYELSGSPDASGDMSLGDGGTAFLDYNGDIAFWDVNDASADNYAMFISTKVAVEYSKSVVNVKLFDKSGAVITPTCKDDVTVTPAAGTISTNVNGGGYALTNGSIVLFSLDSSGKVDALTSAATLVGASYQLSGTTSKDGSLIGTRPVDKSVVVFLLDDGDFELGNIADFNRDTKFENVSHTAIIGSNGKIKAIAAQKSHIYNPGDYSYGVINTTGGAFYDGSKYLSFDGLMDGALFSSKRTNSKTLTGFTSTTTTGIVEFTVDSAGVITGFVTTTAIKGDKFVSEVAVGVTNKVKTASKTQLTLTNSAVYILAGDAVVYVWNATDSKWKLSDYGDLAGKFVKMYTTDKDKVTGFDIILAWE